MLVLSRRVNEAVVLNDNITVTVIDIRGDKVRLGFECPRDMPLHRKEMIDAIRSSSPPPAPSPEMSAVAPPAPPAVPPAPPSLLERVLTALQARLPVPVARDVLTQAIADAAVQEQSADVVRNAAPEDLKAMLLEALKAKT